jgi:hypothetical protein
MFVFDNKATGATLKTEILLTQPTTLSHLSWITYYKRVLISLFSEMGIHAHTQSTVKRGETSGSA